MMDEGTARAEATRLNLRHGSGYKPVRLGDGRWAVIYRSPRSRRSRRRRSRPVRVAS